MCFRIIIHLSFIINFREYTYDFAIRCLQILTGREWSEATLIWRISVVKFSTLPCIYLLLGPGTRMICLVRLKLRLFTHL